MTFSSEGPGKNISTGPKIRIEKTGYLLQEISEKNREEWKPFSFVSPLKTTNLAFLQAYLANVS